MAVKKDDYSHIQPSPHPNIVLHKHFDPFGIVTYDFDTFVITAEKIVIIFDASPFVCLSKSLSSYQLHLVERINSNVFSSIVWITSKRKVGERKRTSEMERERGCVRAVEKGERKRWQTYEGRSG